MSQVLDAVRGKYPQYADVPDDQLAKAIASKFPAYLQQDAELARLAGVAPADAGNVPSYGASTPDNGSWRGQAISTTTGGPRVQLPEAGAGVADVLGESPVARALTAPLAAAGMAAQRGGKVALATAADAGNLAAGQGTPNLDAFVHDPTAPLPYEQTLAQQKGLKSVPEKAAAGMVKMLPALGAGAGLAMAGAPAAVAAAVPMAGDIEGNFDPVGATIAAGLPGVSKLGEDIVAQQLAKLPTAKVVAEVLSRNPLQIKAKVVQKLGGIEVSNDTFRKYLEAGGGMVAANAYLAATQAPQILSLPADQRKEATLDMVAGMLGQSLMGFVVRQGPSETLNQLKPKIAEMWRKANAKPQLAEGTSQVEAGAAPAAPAEKPAILKAGQDMPLPEQPATLNLQLADLQAGKRPAMLFTPGEQELPLPKGFERHETKAGVFFYNPAVFSPKELDAAVANDTVGTVLGYGIPAKPATEQTVGAVTVRTPEGTEKQSVLTDPQHLPAVVAAAQQAANPGDTLAVEPPANVLIDRPPVQTTGPVLGKETFVKGANTAQLPARYAWLPLDQIEASHTGTGTAFASNPNFAPLKNTRDYHTDPSEQEKVLIGAQNFDPVSYAVNVKGAGEGPLMIAPGSDGRYRVLGGNGRKQMLDRLTPEQHAQLGQAQDAEAAVFGLPPRPTDRHVLVRLLPAIDVATPKGIEDANRVVDLLNPSAGLIESSAKLAENDAVKIPASALRDLTPQTGAGLMREFVGNLIGNGTLDRNTRSRLLKSDEELADYVTRLVTHAAYRSHPVTALRTNPKTQPTVTGLIDAGTPLILNLRELGDVGTPVADAFAGLIQRVGEYRKQFPDKKLHQVLQLVADQMEIGGSEALKLSQQLAGVLLKDVEFIEGRSKRGQPVNVLDSDGTVRNFKFTLGKIESAVRAWQRDGGAGADIFGASRTLPESVADALKYLGVTGEPGPTLAEDRARYKASLGEADSSPASQASPAEMTNKASGKPVGDTTGRVAKPVISARISKVKYTLRPNGKFDVSLHTDYDGSIVAGTNTPGMEHNLTYDQLVQKVGPKVAEAIAQDRGENRIDENGWRSGEFNLAEPRATWRYRPVAQVPLGALVVHGNQVVAREPGQHLPEEVYSLHEDGAKVSGPDPRVKRYRELMQQRETAKLTAAQEQELTDIEAGLGQTFIADWNEIATRPEMVEGHRNLGELRRLSNLAASRGNAATTWEEKQKHFADSRYYDAEIRRIERAQMELDAHRKQRLVGADVVTQTELVDKPGQMSLFERRKAYEKAVASGKPLSPAQVEFGFMLGLQTLGQLPPTAGRPGGVGGKSLRIPALESPRTRLLENTASIVRQQILTHGKLDIEGQPCRTVEEAAVLMQAFRCRQMEILHWVMVKDGAVAGHYAMTVRRPSYAVSWDDGGRHDFIRAEMQRLGADGYYLCHNHPSGNPTPSVMDVETTRKVSGHKPDYGSVSGFLGHIIIDHTTYSVIHANGAVQTRELEVSGSDPLLQRARGGLGRRVSPYHVYTAADLANWQLEWLNAENHQLSILFLDAQGRTVATTDVDARAVDVQNVGDLIHDIRALALNVGADVGFGYHNGADGQVDLLATNLVREGVLTDAMRRNSRITVLENLRNSFNYIRPDNHWFGIAHADRKTFRIAEDRAQYERDNADTVASSGLYITTPVLPGSVPAKLKVVLGGMSHIKPVEMPEAVKLVKQVMGQVPDVRKMRGGKRSVFQGEGAGKVVVNWKNFADETAALKTLLHEIGHWMDYMPDQDLKRGNVLGRLYSLHNFLKNKFGGHGITNKEYRQELLDLTRYWKPYDPATDSEWYVKYRESAVELYADAISVLLNSPGLLESKAPKFYAKFWAEVDRKPEVRDALFGLQDFLAKGAVNKLESREADLLAAFAKGEEAWKAAAEERKRLAGSFDGWWTRLWQELYWNHFPSEQRAAQVDKARGLDFAKDPRVFLDNLGYRDVQVMSYGRTIHEKVIKPIEDAGLTLEQAGQFLFLKRVLEGDRNVLANPLGFTPSTARAGLLKMRLDLGMNKMTLLEDAINRFHDESFNLVQQGVEAGIINRKVFEERIVPNRRTYATFAVIEHLDDWIPPGVKSQLGTFKDIANPFQATVLKNIGLIHLIALQRAKNGLVDFLAANFPADLVRSPLEHEPKPEKGRGVLMRLENGAPVWYQTDPYIADSFNRLPPRTLQWAMKPLNWVFQKVYPLIITYNSGFGFALSPLRDMQRTTRNMPGFGLHPQHKLGTALGIASIATGGGIGASVAGVPGAALGGLAGGALAAKIFKRFGGTVGSTARRYLGPQTYTTPTGRTYTGASDPIIREMEANLALMTPFDHFVRAHRDDFMAELLRRTRVLPDHQQQGWFKNIVWTPVRSLLDDIELGSMTLDQSLKVEAYQRLRARGMSPQRAAYEVRNYVGLPNIAKKGSLVQVVKPLVPFWNVFVQGWRADVKVATSPNTAAGWWMKYMLTNGLARMLLATAATGALGAAIKELFDGISEYYKTNYLAVPIGQLPGGDFKSKVVIITIPEDETARFIGGILGKAIRMAGPDDVRASGIFDFGVGQLPTWNPALTVPEKWVEALSGGNPTDPLRGSPIIPRDARLAGGAAIIEPMAGWTLRQTGALNFFRYDPRANSTAELNLGAIPGANKFVRVTDQGYREQQEAKQDIVARIRAQEKLKLPDTVQSLYHEYWQLQQLKDNRTPSQQTRYDDLAYWHKNIYRPGWEDMQAAIEDGKPAVADQIRRQLGRDSADFVRSRR